MLHAPDRFVRFAGAERARAMAQPGYPASVTPLELVTIALILAGGSALQGAAGFGYGMFTVPLLFAAVKLEPFEVIALVTVSVTGQTVFGLWTLRRHIRWRQSAWMIAIACSTLPAGVWLQKQLADLGTDRLKQVIGAMILVAVTIKLVWRMKPRERWPWFWGPIAMICSGFTGGLAGMSGPPSVMWVMAHTWSTERARAALWPLFTAMAPAQIAMLSFTYGSREVLDSSLTGALMWPAVIIGSLPGLWLGRKISPRTMRGISVVILLIAGVIAIGAPLLH